MGMSIQVNDFQWEPGKNDTEYIKLLESSRDEWQKIAQKAIAKLKSQAPRVMTLEELEGLQEDDVVFVEIKPVRDLTCISVELVRFVEKVQDPAT
ncbi:MAG: hypothetical protein K6G54_07385, partial [Oscillospiraceae bacterium]|nr:hypothetical protein [Oscillospiraceae bacterium]